MHYLVTGATHFVLPRGKHSMVKEADYFKSQGGLIGKKNLDGIPWGDNWVPVIADGINHARLLGWMITHNVDHPSAISFTPPNSKTVKELKCPTAS